MALRLAYLTLGRVLSWLALLARSDTAKDVECSVMKSAYFDDTTHARR